MKKIRYRFDVDATTPHAAVLFTEPGGMPLRNLGAEMHADLLALARRWGLAMHEKRNYTATVEAVARELGIAEELGVD